MAKLEMPEGKNIYKLTEIVQMLNKAWQDSGQVGVLSLKGDNIEVTESEVIMKFLCTITLTVRKEMVDLGSLEAINPAVNQSSSEKSRVT